MENLLVLEGQSVLYPLISPNRYSLLSKSENAMLKMFFWHDNDLCFCVFAHHLIIIIIIISSPQHHNRSHLLREAW